VHAPGLRQPAGALRAAHHLLLSHGRSLEVLRHNAAGAELGIVLLVTPVHAASPSEVDAEAARRLDGSFQRWYLDPLYGRGYPADAVADRVRLGHLPGPELEFVRPGDLEAIAAPADFLGVNYYTRTLVRADAAGEPLAVQAVPDDQLTAMGWEVYPDGLHEVLARLTREYAPARIYVTESGAAFEDAPRSNGHVHDPRRVAYLRAHVAAAERALSDGVPLHGYFVWSLMDNFEWSQGLSKRFGLFHVDYATQRRTPRESALWYRDAIAGARRAAPVPEARTRRPS
jgi:beta-glucosidase